MDQVKIGKFIAERRKCVGMTQMQLAERLNITDRAVSKWETGKAMPDSSLMLEVCNILEISVNELLSGERIEDENTDKRSEQLLLNMANEVSQKNKTIWTSMWMLMGLSITMLCVGILVSAFLLPEGVWQLITIFASVALFMIPCLYALKLEVSIGAYKCKNCGNKIVPTYSEALMAMHRGTTRHLHCPVCNKRTWCKKVIDKD